MVVDNYITFDATVKIKVIIGEIGNIDKINFRL